MKLLIYVHYLYSKCVFQFQLQTFLFSHHSILKLLLLHYIKDKLQGKAVYYNTNGDIDHEGLYKDNVKNGAWNFYDENGKLLIQQRYDNGILKNRDEVNEYIMKDQPK